MLCVMAVHSNEPERVEFVCETCKRIIGFAKPKFGEPAATQIGDGWAPPENFLDWMDPCP